MSGIVLVSDTHFSNRAAFGKFESNAEYKGCNSRFHEVAKAVNNAVDYAVKNDCEALFILGDLFHDRQTIHIPVYNAVYKLLEEANKKIKVIVFPGNHDLCDLKATFADDKLHSLLAFDKICTVIHQPQSLETDNFYVGVIPFSITKEAIISQSKSLLKKTNKPSLLMMHHSFNGAETGPAEWVMEHRLHVSDIHKGWNRMFSGHYHKHQTVDKLLEYIGAPLHQDAGERTYIPGFLHVSLDGKSKQIANKLSPRFVVIETDDESKLQELSPHDYNVIRWRGDNRLFEKIKNNIPSNAVVEAKPTVGSFISRTNIQTTDSFEEMMKKYVVAKKGKEAVDLLDHGKMLYEGKI